MKRHIKTSEFRDLPPKAQVFIFAWQRKKGYPCDPRLSIGDHIELLCELSHKLRKDDGIDGNTWKNFILELSDVVIAYEHEEFLDSLHYELVTLFKRLLKNGTLPDSA
jgi:hypothetical protein